MKRFLSVGETITLLAFNEQKDFLITEVLGVGGSCIAYKVKYYENENIPHIGILKEYCPAFLEDENSVRCGNTLNISKNVKDKFSEGLCEFKRTYKSINEYLSNNLSAANYHTVQIGLYEGNNTAYTLTSCDYGMSYDKIDNESLLSICKTMLSVTKAVELYHNAGFLHLDIKPKNILVLNDVADLIKLFDFDSLTSIERLKRREINGVPVPEDYYVPELENYDIRNIGIETDIFEIGAMLFSKVFKRVPEVSDMSYDSKYNIDRNELFVGISPQAKKEFVELLRKTIQISKRSRYKTTRELKTKLEKIISLISEEKPYLLDLPKWQPSKNCVGRKKEIKEIKRRLDEDGYVFIKGIGGLGKSEIAKLFAENYKNEYHTVQFCKFSDSLKSVVATMPINGIDERNYGNAEELIKEKNKVLHLSDDKTLIIVDNFNVTYDDFLRDFLPSDNKSFKVIFTTRCSMAAEYYESKTYILPKLSLEECKELFFAHVSINTNEYEEIAEHLIRFVDYNTLIIVLMAIAIRKSCITLHEMLSYLEEQKIESIETEFFHEYDFSSDEVRAYNRIYAHLTTIFSILGLSDIQKEILKNATLISQDGIGLNDFVKQCDSNSFNQIAVDEVVALGWLNKDSNDIISMHPIISDMFSTNEELDKKESYYNFAEYLEDYCNPDYCHFSVILNKLACAKHLYRRYKFETKSKEMTISVKLGRMYKCIYQPKDAKEYLKRALSIANDLSPDTELTYQGETVNFKGSYRNVFITYIYSFLGEIEKDFGLKNRAIEYYKKCINEGKKLENRFYAVVIESMIAIGECYSENNNNNEAYDSYLEALNYAKKFKLYEYISEISNCLIDVCKILDLKDKESLYEKVANKYSVFADDIEEMPGISAFSSTIETGDFEGGLNAYENVLAHQREELGEESPMYKDLKKSLWVFYAVNNQKEQAMHLLNEDLDFISKTSGEISIDMANQLSSAANIMIRFLDFDAINKFANRAIEICEKLGDLNAYAYVEANLALAHSLLVQGKGIEAKKHIDKIDFSEYSGNEFLSDLVESAGLVLYELSEFDLVENMCIELLHKDNVDYIAKFQATILLSLVNEQKGQLENAENYAEQAKNYIDFVKTEHIKNEWLVQYYRSMAKIQYRKGCYEQGINILNECIELFRNSEDRPFALYAVILERGLYYFFSGNLMKSEEDYKMCEAILKENNFPESAFVTLYNNISVNYQSIGDFERAKKYLVKMCSINKRFVDPKTYFESVVCNNIGWNEYNLGDNNKALDLLKKAIHTFEKLGVNSTYDYYSSKNNLAIVLMAIGQYEDVYKLYSEIRANYNNEIDNTGEVAVKSNFGIVWALLKSNRAQEAYDFSCEELNRFETWFGKTSPIRIKAILQMGGLFREFGYSDCYDFFFLADELMDESGDFNSLNNAKLLNYSGLYFTDEKKEHGFAKLKFEESKQLFEELNATDDEMYPIVVKNIEYVRDLIMDELIGKMAQSMIDETQED